MGKPEEATAAVLPVLGPSRIPGWGSPPSRRAMLHCRAKWREPSRSFSVIQLRGL
jgi:hypothetical protein